MARRRQGQEYREVQAHWPPGPRTPAWDGLWDRLLSEIAAVLAEDRAGADGDRGVEEQS